jgi:Uma2 family endonuclease
MMVAMTVEYLPPELETAPWLGNASALRELPNRPLTVQDLEWIWERLPDGYRLELDEGVLVVYGAPADRHQLASGNLYFALRLACPPEYLVIPAAGLAISQTQFRIPDLKVIRTATYGPKYSTVPPELVVEIASPSTSRYDQTRKKQVYAEFGIPDYWIVAPDADKPEITAYRLDGKQYTQVACARGEERFTATRPFPVSFTPAELVATGQG